MSWRRRYGRPDRPPSTRGLVALIRRADDALLRVGYGRAVTDRRADALLAAALAVPAVVQMLVEPITSLGVALAIALLTTVPVAWRRSYPVQAAFVGLAPGLVPTNASYVIVGYVAIFILLYSAAAYEPDRRPVVAVAAFGVTVALIGSALNDEVLGEYVGAVAAVVFPA